MERVLKHPAWAVVGVVLMAVTVFIAYVTLRGQQHHKALVCRVVSSSRLLAAPQGAAAAVLDVSYAGSRVAEPWLAILEVSNSGDIPIPSADFERPITVEFQGTAKVLSATASSDVAALEPTIETKANSIVIPPVLLNPSDTITLSVLCDGECSDFRVETRIVGVKSVDVQRTPGRGAAVAWLRFLIAGQVVLIFGWGILVAYTVRWAFKHGYATWPMMLAVVTVWAAVIDVQLCVHAVTVIFRQTTG
jgi:hypothetical protein